MNTIERLAGIVLSTTLLSFAAAANAQPVGISSELMSVKVQHKGEIIEIVRNQEIDNTVTPDFALTSRPCPPFCIQPMVVADGVETLGELEVIDYIRKMQIAGSNIMLVDSRTPDWVERGTIPGSTNVSWVDLAPSQGATTESITAVMTNTLGVIVADGIDEIDIDVAIVDGTLGELLDYSEAKTLVLFCNGMWCGQSPESIKTLLKYGYPAGKLKWYRGGMQAWEILSLTTVQP